MFTYKKTQGITVNENSHFDIQIKRMHGIQTSRNETLLYVIHKYLDIKSGNPSARPITIIFGGKAACSCIIVIAQDVSHFNSFII